jgi:hypothetical protein
MQLLFMSFFSSKIIALVELRRIEVAEDIATQLSNSPNIVYLNEGSNMLLSAGGLIKN